MEIDKVFAKSSIPPDMLPTGSLSSEQIFQYLRPEQINKLSNASGTIKCKTGDTIYRAGMENFHVYRVLSGEVVLLLPERSGDEVVMNKLGPNAMFGSSLSFKEKKYILTARCSKDSEILKIKTSVLKQILDEEPRVGYAIQSNLSETYFFRYIQTVKKLQSAYSMLPLEKRFEESADSAFEYLHVNGQVYGRYAQTPPIVNSVEAYKYGLEFLSAPRSQYSRSYEEGKHVKLRIVFKDRNEHLTCHGTIDHVENIWETGEYKLGISHLSLNDDEFELLKHNSVNGPLQSMLFVSSLREGQAEPTKPFKSDSGTAMERIKAVTMPVELIESVDRHRGSTPFSEFVTQAIRNYIS